MEKKFFSEKNGFRAANFRDGELKIPGGICKKKIEFPPSLINFFYASVHPNPS